MSNLRCRIFDHQWKFSMSSGDAREYMCTRCRQRKVIVNGVTLSPEDSAEYSPAGPIVK